MEIENPEDFGNPGDLVILAAGSRERRFEIIEKAGNLPPEKLPGGIILTCAEKCTLEPEMQKRLLRSSIPTLLVNEDSAETEKKVLRCFENTKVQLFDAGKYERIVQLFRDHFDFDKFKNTFLHDS